MLPTNRPDQALGASLRGHAGTLLGPLALMWVTEIVDHLPFIGLDYLGIRPRTLGGLLGILFAPFLHKGFPHLIANTVPFIVLGGLVLLGGRRLFWNVTVFVALLGGFGVWLLGPRNTVHIGASGVIFGYLGFLLARGFIERSLVWIVVSIGIMVLYGGLLWGVLPLTFGVSWQGHLFGFLAGVAAAWLLFAERTRSE